MVFDSKGLTDKVFENKPLSGDLLGLVVKERPKMGFWWLQWPGALVTAPITSPLSRTAGLAVCDGAHWVIVMKKSDQRAGLPVGRRSPTFRGTSELRRSAKNP